MLKRYSQADGDYIDGYATPYSFAARVLGVSIDSVESLAAIDGVGFTDAEFSRWEDGEWRTYIEEVVPWDWVKSFDRIAVAIAKQTGKNTEKVGKRTRYLVIARDKRCKLCGRGPEDTVLHVDHIIPRAAGGSNDPCNLRVLCADCNIGKGALIPNEAAA